MFMQTLPLYYLTRNCSALRAADTRALSQLSCTIRALLGVPLVCTTLQPTW